MAVVPLRNVPAELKQYLVHHRIPDICEALMTALAMMCPEDPYLFIINKLLHIKEQGLQSVRWDMFLDETIKSRRALYKCRFEFSFEEDEDENVMRELFLRAYEYFNLKLKWRGLNAFISNWTACKEKKEGVIAKVLRIQTQRQYKFVYTAFFAWKEWTQQIVDRYAIFHFTAAQQLLDHVWDLQLCKTIFNAWHHVTLESIQQKEYFDRLEKGENTENEEPIPSKNCLPEVHDSISTLPYKVSVQDDHLLLIARRCHILLYLNISHTLITDTALRIIARYLSNLLCLSLAYCRRFTDRGMTYLAQGECCKNLEHLDLSNCLQLTPEGFMQIFNKCDNLKVFIVDEFPTLTDQCIQSILLHCSKLEHISFLGSPLLTDAAFQKFPKTLKIIKLEGNNRISDMSIKLLSRMCPNVSHIYLADCQRLTDICLRYLATCKQLTILNLAECINITDAGIRSFSDGICAIKLRELNLSNCVHLGDMSLIIISKKLQNLTYLSLSFCDNISESSLEALGQAPNLISLDISGSSCSDQSISAIGKRARMKNINISQCTNITDLGLQKFAKQCPGLEQIDLSHCLQITDVAIKNLAFCCRLLSCVKLSGCKFITDLAPQYLSGVCHYLVQLDLNGCSLITDKGMKYVQKGCNWLRILNILYCKSISKSIVQKMKRSIDTVNYNGEECHPSLEC
eukprot:XP_014767597.1 PREDICTED: F-box/LRR-repeat protein 13-like isoform X7 [Octopus bimaculoides]